VNEADHRPVRGWYVGRRLNYKITHIIATWGIGVFVLAAGFLRFRIADTHLLLAFGPGLAIIAVGEYLRNKYLRDSLDRPTAGSAADRDAADD
jgi:hypothetical protein